MSRRSSSGPDTLFTVETWSLIVVCACWTACWCACVRASPDSREDTTLKASRAAACSLCPSSCSRLLLSSVFQLWILIGWAEAGVSTSCFPGWSVALLSRLFSPWPVCVLASDGTVGFAGAARTTLVWAWTSSKMHFCTTPGISTKVRTSVAAQSVCDGGNTMMPGEAGGTSLNSETKIQGKIFQPNNFDNYTVYISFGTSGPTQPWTCWPENLIQNDIGQKKKLIKKQVDYYMRIWYYRTQLLSICRHTVFVDLSNNPNVSCFYLKRYRLKLLCADESWVTKLDCRF